MDASNLALTMKRLAFRVDQVCRTASIVQHQVAEPPFGSAYVCISPGEQSPYASYNHNRIHLCGTEPGLTAEGLRQLTGLFAEAGVERYFIWLSPGPEMDTVRGWLTGLGLAPAPYVTYHTLVRDAGDTAPITTDLDIREVEPGEIAALADRWGDAAWPEYLASAGADGFHHFAAFDNGQPVASAALCNFEGIGYLGMALTAEAARRRGAQRALIAKRIAKATALGCTTLVSETLSILPISLGNLQKAGFQHLYDKEVYRVAEPSGAA